MQHRAALVCDLHMLMSVSPKSRCRVRPRWLTARRNLQVSQASSQVGQFESAGFESNDTIPQHTPKEDANTVLELNKGEAAKLNLQPGSKLDWDACWQ